jgi:hypothetical protein
MRKGRRSGERLFCWSELHRGGRGPSIPQSDRSAPLRMTALRVAVLVTMIMAGYVGWAAGPALTTIQDTVYRADGTAAAGIV